MAMVPYMAGGYAIDRMMGGDGKIGLALGTGAGAFGTGAIGGSALGGATASTAGSTSMMSTLAAPTATTGLGAGATMGASSIANPMAGMSPVASANSFGTVNPLTTGGVSESISPFTPMGTSGIGGNVGFLGQPISNQAVNSSLTEAKGLLDWGIENSYVQDGFDFINDGWDGMSLMDKANTGMLGSQAIDAANPTPEYPQVAPPQIAQRKPVATSGNPVSIQVGRRNTEFVDPEQLYKDRYRYA
jgi:hypothetical protein